MTTEKEFQTRLNRVPHDHHTRLVFADWLDEHGDARGAGYRALGLHRVLTFGVGGQLAGEVRMWTWFCTGRAVGEKRRELPHDWFALLIGWVCLYTNGKPAGNGGEVWRDYRSRQLADDAAALAFAKLPAERRAELLSPVEVPA